MRGCSINAEQMLLECSRCALLATAALVAAATAAARATYFLPYKKGIALSTQASAPTHQPLLPFTGHSKLHGRGDFDGGAGFGWIA